MADSPRSVSELSEMLGYNTTGNIAPQHLKYLLHSALGVYGSLSCFEASTQQNEPDTGAKLTCFTAAGAAKGCTPDYTNDQITVDVAGVYDIAFQVAFSGTNSSTVKFRLRVNGVENPLGGVTRKLGNTDIGACGFNAHGVELNAGDVLSVWVSCDTATDDITVADCQFGARMVG